MKVQFNTPSPVPMLKKQDAPKPPREPQEKVDLGGGAPSRFISKVVAPAAGAAVVGGGLAALAYSGGIKGAVATAVGSGMLGVAGAGLALGGLLVAVAEESPILAIGLLLVGLPVGAFALGGAAIASAAGVWATGTGGGVLAAGLAGAGGALLGGALVRSIQKSFYPYQEIVAPPRGQAG